jgi:hypothetical protein
MFDSVKINNIVSKEPVNKVTITIGEDKYRLTMSVDRKLVINKISSDSSVEHMTVFPRYANEIEVK